MSYITIVLVSGLGVTMAGSEGPGLKPSLLSSLCSILLLLGLIPPVLVQYNKFNPLDKGRQILQKQKHPVSRINHSELKRSCNFQAICRSFDFSL